MKRRFLRPIAVGIATLSTMATMVIGAVSSEAAQIGTISFSPSTGTDANTLSLSTSSLCPGGTNYQVAVTGAGFPSEGFPVTANNDQTIIPQGGSGYTGLTLLDTMKNFALQQAPPASLAGNTYTFTGTCQNSFGATTFGTHVGQITFDASLHYAVVAPPVTTTTALASTPASPVNTGVPVTFTAAVASSGATATGTVQLFDGTTAIGSPTAVNASGQAVITTSFATGGSHSITAAFTGSSASVGNSVSSAIVYTVNVVVGATTTALAISPAAADSNTPVTLTATVSPGAAPGTVQFLDGATNVGAPVTVSGGTASVTQVFPAGAHSFTAAFTSSSGTFGNSTSTSQGITVTPGATNTATETIETTINAGSLTISVADNTKVVLPSPVLNASGTYLTTASNSAVSRLHAVTVTDTRAGNPGWTVTGQVSDFQNTTGPTSTPINGVNLGWTPNVIDSSSGAVTPGAVVLPETPPVTANPAVDDGKGLHFGRTLAKALAGSGTGTSHVDAALALNVPTTVIAGTYDATLTLTVA